MVDVAAADCKDNHENQANDRNNGCQAVRQSICPFFSVQLGGRNVLCHFCCLVIVTGDVYEMDNPPYQDIGRRAITALSIVKACNDSSSGWRARGQCIGGSDCIADVTVLWERDRGG